MNKREGSKREIIGGFIGFLVVSCIYGGYLYRRCACKIHYKRDCCFYGVCSRCYFHWVDYLFSLSICLDKDKKGQIKIILVGS